jgi:RNA polymerase sigma-70 factor (ECF subfamily)
MSASNFHDKILAERIKKQDPDAIGIVYDRYVTPIYRFVYLKLPSRQDAEDVTSETFLRLWQYVQNAEHEVENVRALLYQIARNLVVDFYRHRSRVEEVMDDETKFENIPDARQQSFLSDLDVELATKDVQHILRQMKDEYREVITLKYIEQLSTGEIADILGKSKGAVRVLLTRALKVARQLLEETSTHATN